MRGRAALVGLSALLLLTAGLSRAFISRATDRPAPEPVKNAGNATFRLGTWNIEWLGRPDKRRSGAQKPEDLARYIAASKVDILCLNEISSDGENAGFPTNSTLLKTTALLKDLTGQEWKHVLFTKKDPKEKDQLTGVLWNAGRVKLIDRPFRIPIRRNKYNDAIWPRHPWAAKFSTGEGKTDLVVIPVHSKSNYGGVDEAIKQRSEEAKMLIRALGEVQNHFKDDDILIIGDFNALKHTEEGLKRFALAGFKDLNSGDALTWIKSDRYDAAPFDRILVPDDQPEFKKVALTVNKTHHLGSETEFRKFLSDHYMVLMELQSVEDDD